MSANNQNTVNKRKKGIETREKIFKTSARLFAKYGYDNVSIRKIASSINIKESSIYNHFPSKKAILTSLFEHFYDEVLKDKPTVEELEKLMMIMNAEEVLKNLIIHLGQTIDDTLDHIATIIFVERFRNKQAAELYFNCIIDEQIIYYEKVFTLMKNKGLINSSDVHTKELATQYNFTLVTLAMEYAMAKNDMTDPMMIIKKMMDTASFFVKASRL